MENIQYISLRISISRYSLIHSITEIFLNSMHVYSIPRLLQVYRIVGMNITAYKWILSRLLCTYCVNLIFKLAAFFFYLSYCAVHYCTYVTSLLAISSLKTWNLGLSLVRESYQWNLMKYIICYILRNRGTLCIYLSVSVFSLQLIRLDLSNKR